MGPWYPDKNDLEASKSSALKHLSRFWKCSNIQKFYGTVNALDNCCFSKCFHEGKMLEDYMQWKQFRRRDGAAMPSPFNAKERQNWGHPTCIPSWMHCAVVCRRVVLEVLQVLRPQPHVLIHGRCSLHDCHGSTYSLCSFQLSLLQTLSGLHYGRKRRWAVNSPKDLSER